MPLIASMRLEVPCYRQSDPSACLPACLRMVLEYLNHDQDEAALAALCGTRRIGTTLWSALRVLNQLGLDALYTADADLHDLSGYLAEDLPVIVALRLEALHPNVRGVHAVVVCGLDGDAVWVNDPASGSAIRLSADEFFRAWAQYGAEGIVILG